MRPKVGWVRGGKGMQLVFWRGLGDLGLRSKGKYGEDFAPRGRGLRGVVGVGVTGGVMD